MSRPISRRTFAAMLPATALLSGCATSSTSTSKPSAAEVVDRIQAQLRAEGVAPIPQTLDTFKLGDIHRPVTGVATTFMATYDVLQRAHAAGLSLVISHEPSLFHVSDSLEIADGPTLRAKRAFAEANGLVVWRFHDYWHPRRPDPIIAALADKLGMPYGADGFELPPTRFIDLVARMERALDTKNLRYWGDPDRVVTGLGLTAHQLSAVAGKPNVAHFWPEPKEFNTFEYFRDAQELGVDRCIIGGTHELMEEWGMLEPCAAWVRALVPEVPVRPIQSEELYWTA